MKKRIRIGSRKSRLAAIQAEIVKQMIEKNCPEITVEIVTMMTTGDQILDQKLDQIGGKGLFVKELDKALREERIDIAVHSLKDMPMDTAPDLPILAYTLREDPRDALIYKPDRIQVRPGEIIGTSSNRRTLQIKKLYPECHFQGIRGNVQTRLDKLLSEPFAGIVLAAAGLRRLGMAGLIGRIFAVDEVVPAAGQGILAVQGRKGEAAFSYACLNDRDSETAALAEREFVAALDGGCSSPVAAYAQVEGQEVKLTGLYYREADGSYYTATAAGDRTAARKLGQGLAEEMRQKYE